MRTITQNCHQFLEFEHINLYITFKKRHIKQKSEQYPIKILFGGMNIVKFVFLRKISKKSLLKFS